MTNSETIVIRPVKLITGLGPRGEIIVTKVVWMATSTAQTVSSSAQVFGETDVEPGDLVVPYDELTEEIVCGWIKAKMTEEEVREVEQRLQVLPVPPIPDLPLPWASEPYWEGLQPGELLPPPEEQEPWPEELALKGDEIPMGYDANGPLGPPLRFL